MYPADFAYERPTTLAEAIRLLQQSDGEAKVLAGGHSLLPMMKLRLVQPPLLVDLSAIPALAGIDEVDEGLRIGAMVTETDLQDSPLVQRLCPLLAETAGHIGDPQVRNRGTIGGTLAHGDPAADMPAAFLALGGSVTAIGPNGERRIAAADLFVDMLTTALEPDEVLTSVQVPALGSRTGSAYEKFANAASGYALAGAAAIVTLDEAGACADLRVAITGVANKAARLTAVEDALRGRRLDDDAITAAAEQAPDGLFLLSDLHADEGFRAQLAKIVTRRAVQRAASRAATHA